MVRLTDYAAAQEALSVSLAGEQAARPDLFGGYYRQQFELLLRNHPRPRTDGPIQITLTRIAPRRLDDDNLASGFKATRDGVADWLGIDDGAKRLEWRYAQRKGRPGQLGAEVVVMWWLNV